MKPKSPSALFWSLSQLAQDFGRTLDQIEIDLSMAGIQIGSYPSPHREIPAISRADRLKFEEYMQPSPEPAKYRSDERATHLSLIGALAVLRAGREVSLILEPGRLLADLERCAAPVGVPILRTGDTYVAVLREAFKLLQANGYRMPKLPTKTQPAQSENNSENRTPVKTSDTARAA